MKNKPLITAIASALLLLLSTTGVIDPGQAAELLPYTEGQVEIVVISGLTFTTILGLGKALWNKIYGGKG